MSKHTPGPWHIVNLKDAIGIYSADGRFVARIPNSFEETEDRRRADAALMCAAPDMLAALEACELRLTRLGQDSQKVTAELKRARAAIAKATGDDDASQV